MTRIALFQSNTGIDPAKNARALDQAIGEAAAGGAEILFTPEMSGLLDRDSARALKNLKTEEDDQVLASCREAARRHGIWLHIGSLAVLVDDGKVANRGFVIDREGDVRAPLRQAPFVRCRPADRRELARIQCLFGRARASCWSTARRSASSALPSATTCASPDCSRGSRRPTPT